MMKQISGFHPTPKPGNPGWVQDAVFECDQCGNREHINFADFEADPAIYNHPDQVSAWGAFLECAKNLATDTHECPA
jgi:hypothetical protein